MGKNKGLAHHTSKYLHTRRVSKATYILHEDTPSNTRDRSITQLATMSLDLKKIEKRQLWVWPIEWLKLNICKLCGTLNLRFIYTYDMDYK